MKRTLKYFWLMAAVLGILPSTEIFAAGPPEPSPFSNPLAVTLVVLMLLLLIIIGVLGYILIGMADLKMRKDKKKKTGPFAAALVSGFLLMPSTTLFAQDTAAATETVSTIGGLSATAFYIMIAVIFLEMFIILALLVNIKLLLRTEKEKIQSAEEKEMVKKTRLNWWDRFNKLRPVSQEAELDLGHEYDGIRELNNRLPPWWLYGFYVTILFAAIYLWRFHVSHTGPSSKEEYERSVARAEARIQEHLKQKGEAVDENSVTVLTEANDLDQGRLIYMKSCATCHKDNGAGDVGPNLTDDYWIHGNDIKSVFKVIRYGINAMPQWQNTYSNKQIAQVASYIKTLHGTNPPNAKPPQGVLQKEEPAPVADSATAGNKIVMNQ